MDESCGLPWGREEIEKRLPQKDPFLLLDRVDVIEKWAFCQAVNEISSQDPIFQGHFPGHPMYPGVMTLESLAQTSCLLIQNSFASPMEKCYLAGIKNARFYGHVVPDKSLVCAVKFLFKRPPFYWSEGECFVDGEKKARATIMAFATTVSSSS